MAYSARDVANWFIAKANEGYSTESADTEHKEYPESISHLKLQKLLYFAQAAHLALEGSKLFEDKIEAWAFGPVVLSVYQDFRQYGNKPIQEPKNKKYKTVITLSDRKFLEQIWEIFGKFSASRLVDITHGHRPWQSAYKAKNKEITSKVLKEYYKGVFRSIE